MLAQQGHHAVCDTKSGQPGNSDHDSALSVQVPVALSGNQLLQPYELPAAELRAALDHFAASVIADMATGHAANMAEAHEWAQASRLAFTEILDGQLRRYEPRAGQIEEGLQRQRGSELLAQRRRVDAFVRARGKVINAQVCLLLLARACTPCNECVVGAVTSAWMFPGQTDRCGQSASSSCNKLASASHG